MPGTGTKTGIQLCRIPVRLASRSSQAHSGEMASPDFQDQLPAGQTQLFSKIAYVPNRSAHGDRKTGPVRSPAHETYPVASEEQLAYPGMVGKDHPDSRISSPGWRRTFSRANLCPPSSRRSDLYRHIKQRLGRTFRRLYRKRSVIRPRKQASYQFLRIESSPVGPRKVRTPLPGPSGSSGNGQYHCSSIHKQRRRNAVRLSLCSPVETPIVVQPQGNLSEGTPHSGSAQSDSRQALQTPTDHSDGMVSAPRGLCSDLPQVAPPPSGSVCNQVQFQTPSVRIPRSRPEGMGHGCHDHTVGDLYAFPPIPLLTNVLT